MAARPKLRMIGRYIVADPAVCHGQPTFRGTRILVGDVLEQVSAGMAGRESPWSGRNGCQKRLSPRPFGSPARRSRITLASTSRLNTRCSPFVHDRPRSSKLNL